MLVEFVPTGSRSIFLEWVRTLNLCVKPQRFPTGSNLPVVEVPFRGHRLKIAGDRTFEDWTVTIINDVNFTSRTAVEQWMESIQELDSGVGATDLDYLVSRATISQLNRDDSIIATYELYNMYPQTLANIELSYDTADEIQSFDVTFSYSHWERTL